MSGEHESALEATGAAQRRVLLQVMLLNAMLAAALFAGGVVADSSGLLANAMDNLSDALTYAASYFAVTRSRRWKALAAGLTGIMLFVLAIGVTLDAARRYFEGSEPMGAAMIGLSLVATAVNFWCIRLLAGFRKAEVNLRAAWTMSLNDFASNFGILLAGLVVWLTGRSWPDLVVGLLIAAVAAYGGVKTLLDARAEAAKDR